MTTPILYTPKPGAKWADFGSGGHAAAWYADLATTGFTGVILDTYSAQAADVQAALGAGLGVMLFQGFDPQAWADPALATSRAQQAVAFATQIAYPKGATLWLDFESCATSVPAAAAWINAWARVVEMAGYFPGIYVGAPQPFSSLQLYALLQMMHYWRSESTVPTVAQRGYQVVQEQGNVLCDGVLIDTDRIHMDDLGGLPHGMILPTAKPAPAPTPQPAPTPSRAEEIAALQHQVAELQAVIAHVQQDVKGE